MAILQYQIFLGYEYYVTFIDDFSCYIMLQLIC